MRKNSLVKLVAVASSLTLVANMAIANPVAYASDDDWEIDTTSDDYNDDDDYDDSLSDDLEISAEELKLNVGQQKMLEIYGEYDSVSWKSSKKSVASVDEDGYVQAKKAGKAEITAEVTYTAYSESDADDSDADDYYVEAFGRNVDSEIGAFGYDDDDDDYDEFDDLEDWDEDDDNDWDEDEDGRKVTVEFTCTVIVTAKASLSDTNVSLKSGATKTLKVKNSSGKVTWTSSNAKIASVDKKGKVTAKKKGKVTITAKVSGQTLKCVVKVK